MPNRILKESITTSEEIEKLSPGAEILFYRLIVMADDFGCFLGNEKIIKGRCYPLRDSLKPSQITNWLTELDEAGLIIWYIAPDGKKYIQFVTWSEHQNIRNKHPKYPLFSDECQRVNSIDSNCNQLSAIAPVIQSNPIQSESNPNPIRITSASKCSRPTLEDVKAYVIERGSTVDPEKFFEYYDTGGWKDAKGNPVKNWKQKLITWENKENGRKQDRKTNNQFLQMLEDEYGQASSN